MNGGPLLTAVPTTHATPSVGVSPQPVPAAHTSGTPGSSLLILLLIGIVIGLHHGRKRGLKHLSEVEFNRRWQQVRDHKRF